MMVVVEELKAPHPFPLSTPLPPRRVTRPPSVAPTDRIGRDVETRGVTSTTYSAGYVSLGAAGRHSPHLE